VGEFSAEGVREFDAWGSAFAVEIVEQADSVEVVRQRLFEAGGKEGCAITVTFPPAYDDLVTGGVEILDAQAEALEQT
jgi:hypothetical protein